MDDDEDDSEELSLELPDGGGRAVSVASAATLGPRDDKSASLGPRDDKDTGSFSKADVGGGTGTVTPWGAFVPAPRPALHTAPHPESAKKGEDAAADAVKNEEEGKSNEIMQQAMSQRAESNLQQLDHCTEGKARTEAPLFSVVANTSKAVPMSAGGEALDALLPSTTTLGAASVASPDRRMGNSGSHEKEERSGESFPPKTETTNDGAWAAVDSMLEDLLVGEKEPDQQNEDLAGARRTHPRPGDSRDIDASARGEHESRDDIEILEIDEVTSSPSSRYPAAIGSNTLPPRDHGGSIRMGTNSVEVENKVTTVEEDPLRLTLGKNTVDGDAKRLTTLETAFATGNDSAQDAKKIMTLDNGITTGRNHDVEDDDEKPTTTLDKVIMTGGIKNSVQDEQKCTMVEDKVKDRTTEDEDGGRGKDEEASDSDELSLDLPDGLVVATSTSSHASPTLDREETPGRGFAGEDDAGGSGKIVSGMSAASTRPPKQMEMIDDAMDHDVRVSGETDLFRSKDMEKDGVILEDEAPPEGNGAHNMDDGSSTNLAPDSGISTTMQNVECHARNDDDPHILMQRPMEAVGVYKPAGSAAPTADEQTECAIEPQANNSRGEEFAAHRDRMKGEDEVVASEGDSDDGTMWLDQLLESSDSSKVLPVAQVVLKNDMQVLVSPTNADRMKQAMISPTHADDRMKQAMISPTSANPDEHGANRDRGDQAVASPKDFDRGMHVAAIDDRSVEKASKKRRFCSPRS